MTTHNAKAAVRLTLAVWVFVATALPTLSHAHTGDNHRHGHDEPTGAADRLPAGAPVRHQHLGLFGVDLQFPAPPAESDRDGAPHTARLAPLDGAVKPAGHPLSSLASDNGSVLCLRLAPPTSTLWHRDPAPGAAARAGTLLDRTGVRRC